MADPGPNVPRDPPTTPPAQPPPQPPPAGGSTSSPSAIDIQARIVNGILVVGVVGIVGMLYTYKGADASMFGTFTTLVGTALSAYFGISATREVSRNAVDSSNQQTADANQQLGQVTQQHAVAQGKVEALKSLVGPAPAPASDPPPGAPPAGVPAPDPQLRHTMSQIRNILAQ